MSNINEKKSWYFKVTFLGFCFTVMNINSIVHANSLGAVKKLTTSFSSTSKDYKSTQQEYRMPKLNLIRNNGVNTPLTEIFKKDKSVIVNFIFTSCNTICPIMTGTFARLDKKLRKTDKEINLVSISIDPEFDTPRQLLLYAKVLRASDNWQFYTGNRKDIIKLQTAFNAYRGSKMNHVPITLIKNKDSEKWTRIDGFASADELLKHTEE